MSNSIHSTAIIGKDVTLGENNKIGPHVIIEDGVRLGSNNTLLAGAYLAKGTSIGDKNEIHMQAVIGHTPQDLSFEDKLTYTKIGNANIIREFTTIHRGTEEGTSTVIGNKNYIMAYCHIAHNCEIKNEVIMVNQASLTGHVLVEDKAFISGMTGFHQFSRVGKLSMVSALSACNKDIPPYMTCGGRPGVVVGINVVGLKRSGFSPEIRAEIKQAYKLLYRSGLNTSQAVAAIKNSLKSEETKHLVDFIESSKRGIVDGANSSEEETLKARKG